MLRLPDGLEVVGKEWFVDSSIKKLVVPSGVRVLDSKAFVRCQQLREVVFEPGSHLELIGDFCFAGCGIEKICLPGNLKTIVDFAFYGCQKLSQLSFEHESQLEYVGDTVFYGTLLTPESMRCLDTFGMEEHEKSGDQ